MTVKLLLLKSGEDLIAEVQEMVFGEDEEKRVVGYYLTRPCIVKMRTPNLLTEENQNQGLQRMGYQVTLHPWMPLTSDDKIPVPSDWLVTMVNPTEKLKEMYIEDVINHGKNNQSVISDEQSNCDQ
jgi:hypothetical protein